MTRTRNVGILFIVKIEVKDAERRLGATRYRRHMLSEIDRPKGKRPGSKGKTKVVTVDGGQVKQRSDSLATEEPLEIRLLAGGERQNVTRNVAVTMRTPGADFELAAGFLFGEGILKSRDDLLRMSYCTEAEQRYNVVNVALRGEMPDVARLERHFTTTSACGVCGKASLESLALQACPLPAPTFSVTPDVITSLPDKLRQAQGLFEATGGLHAAALFTKTGELLALREDVGRHNALDKLVGWALLEGLLPLSEHIVLLSGRASFELLQKSLTAGVPLVCAVSAPSSLAVSVAHNFNLTLVGFLRGERFNIYSGEARINLSGAERRDEHIHTSAQAR